MPSDAGAADAHPRPGADPGVFADARHTGVRDRDGRRLGTLEQVLVSADTGRPLWVEVAGGLYGMARTIAPAGGARREGRTVVLDTTADLVAHAPTIDPEDGLTSAEHAELAAHYGSLTGDVNEATDSGR